MAFAPESKKVTTLAIIIFGIVLFLVAFGQVSFNDFWWHLAIGKWMFATNSFLTHELFSYAFQGKEWMNGTWIFDGLLYLIYSASSFWGLSVLRFVIFVATYVVFIAAVRIRHKVPLILCISVFLMTVPQIRNFLRPEITQPLFTALFLYGLYAYKYRGSKILYTLPLIEAVWVNTHGSFELGMILVGIFFGSELVRSLIQYRDNIMLALQKNKKLAGYFFTLVATAGATLINPLGYRIYHYVSVMLHDKETLAFISEWQPFSFTSLLNFSSARLLPLAFLGCASILLMSVRTLEFLKKKKKPLAILQKFFYEDALLLLFFLFSMLKYIRLTSIFTFVAAFLILKNYRIIFKKFDSLAALSGLFLLPFALLLFYSTNKPYMRFNTGPDDFSQAKESITFVKNNKLPGHLFNQYEDGGDIIWLLYPQYQVFMDGRAANVYDSNFYWYYRNIASGNNLDALSQRYDLSFAVVPIGSGLSELLTQSKKWTLVFFDNYEDVFVKNEAVDEKFIDDNAFSILNPKYNDKHYIELCKNKESKDDLLKEIDRNLKALEKPVYSMVILATMLAECQDKTAADLQLAKSLMIKAISYKPSDPVVYYKLGTIQIALDQDDQAISSFKKAIKLSKNRPNMTGLGIALHNTGDYPAAEKVFAQVPFLPGDAPNEYYQIYGRVSYQLDNNAKAIELFQRYLDLIDTDTITVQDYLDLASAYKDDNQPDESQKYLDLAKNFKTPTSTKNLQK